MCRTRKCRLSAGEARRLTAGHVTGRGPNGADCVLGWRNRGGAHGRIDQPCPGGVDRQSSDGDHRRGVHSLAEHGLAAVHGPLPAADPRRHRNLRLAVRTGDGAAEHHSAFGINFGGGLVAGLGLAGTGFGVLIGSVSRAVPAERRIRTVGLVSAAGSLGTLALAPLGQALITDYGWRAALIAFVAVAASMAAIAVAIGKE